MFCSILVTLLMALNIFSASPDIKEGIQGYTPSAETFAAKEQFRDDKFGVFIHWGIYSMMARGEWVMYNEKLPYDEYSRFAGGFFPSRFDAGQWVRQIKASGAKYITITSRHHDGFSMFDTKASDYDIIDATPFKRDVLKELIPCLTGAATIIRAILPSPTQPKSGNCMRSISISCAPR